MTAYGYRPACPAALHDTGSAYKRKGCRCPDAIAAHRARQAADRAARPRAAQRYPAVHRDVDEVAVFRALRGERMHLGVNERRRAVVELTRDGRSLNWIARQLGVSTITVSRCRLWARRAAA